MRSTWLKLAGCMVAALFLAGNACAQDSQMARDVIRLLKANIGEDVILSYVTTGGTKDKVSAEDIVLLKKAGATEAILLALLGSTRPGGSAFSFTLDAQHEVLAPVARGPLAVYPVICRGPSSATAFLTLDEALEQRVITIREKDGGSVPLVQVTNTGRLPIYLAAGEVVVGGKQDRMVAYDVLVETGRTMDIEVRCVEKGRWRGNSADFSSARAMGGLSTRSAAQFKTQEDVWREVATQNAALGVSTRSSAYQAALTKSDVDREYNACARAIMPVLDGRLVVGMIVAVNGKVQTMDIFASPALFAKMKAKLLKAAVLDIIGIEDRKAAPPGRDAIMSFYRQTLDASTEASKRYSDNLNVRRESSAAIMNESADHSGNVLHRGFYAK